MPPQKKSRNAASPRAVRITERRNPNSAALDTKSTAEILRIINREDRKVAGAVSKVIPQIARAVDLAVDALSRGGRLVYLGAGTSGRLGVLDAAECIPTFGTEQVVAVMAGAPNSMFRPSEVSEDNPKLGERDLRGIKFNGKDVLVGISASGRTPYVLGGLRHAARRGAVTVLLTADPDAEGRCLATVLIAPAVGPEVIAGSTRMKAGTAHKLVLNMLSTATMVRLGRVFSNLMIGVQLTNSKLRKRALGILMDGAGVSAGRARKALEDAGNSLPVALLTLATGTAKSEAVVKLKADSTPAEVLRRAFAGAVSDRASLISRRTKTV
jgi:N-acetylmuramic acid 6-phosphate etherase